MLLINLQANSRVPSKLQSKTSCCCINCSDLSETLKLQPFHSMFTINEHFSLSLGSKANIRMADEEKLSEMKIVCLFFQQRGRPGISQKFPATAIFEGKISPKVRKLKMRNFATKHAYYIHKLGK